ncbi:MAG: nuclear transport factor 2 family protein [Bradymonadia bacterium]
MLTLLLALLPILNTQVPAEQAIISVLDDFHDAASKADGPRYFGHFAEGGIFIGTDPEERWTVAAFKAYAEPHFSKGKGWTYTPKERHVHLGPDGKTAWFYERLHNAKYGEARGSGVLVIESGHWRIAQYVLSFPIPNEATPAVMKAIQGPGQ